MDSVNNVDHDELPSVDRELKETQEALDTKMTDQQPSEPPVPSSIENGQVNNKGDTEETALRNALERIGILEKEINLAKDEVIQCKKASQEEISRLLNDLQAKHESAVGEAAHLAQEIEKYKNEAAKLKIDLQKSGEDCEISKERLKELEKELSSAHERIKNSEEEFSVKLKSHQEELLKRDENEGYINKAHEDTRVQLQTAQKRVIELEAALSTASAAKDEAVAALEKELDGARSKFADELKQHESKFQAQLLIAEEKNTHMVKSLSESEGKVIELEKSLAATTSDHGSTMQKISELEHALGIASEKNEKLEEGTLELQEKLRAKDESLEKLAENIKEYEEKLGKANEVVVQLESTLRVSEGKLKASEVVVEGLQLQLADLKTQNETQTKCLEEAKENLQLEVQLKSTLEGKIKESQESLHAVQCQADNLTTKVDDLNTYIKILENEKCQLEEKLRASEEKCSDHFNAAQTSTARSVELEGIVGHHKTIADDAVSKLAALEATLVDAKSHNSELEAALADYQKNNEELQMKFNQAQETVMRLQNEANDSSAQIAKLETLEKASAAKVTELENVCADLKRREEVLSQNLESTEKLLAERQTQIDDSNKRTTELELSIAHFETELKASSEREKSFIEEKEIREVKVVEMQTQLDVATSKISELESSIAAKERDFSDAVEKTNHLTKEKTLLEDKIVNLAAELELLLKQSSTKVHELETSCANSRQIEDDLTKKLQSSEKKLEEKQLEIDELKSSLLTVNSDLKKALEKHAEEKSFLDDKMVKLENDKSSREVEIAEAKSRISLLEPLVEKSKIDLQAAAINEGKLKEEISCHQASNNELQDRLSRLQSEKDALLAQHEGSHKNVTEANEKLIQEVEQLQSQIETHTKKYNDSNEELRICKEQLQVSLSKEASLDKQVTDLKIQLARALATHNRLEELEDKLKNTITTEEHKAKVDELLITSRLYEDKLTEAEKQLSDTKMEIVKVQKAYNEREIHLKELEAKSEKSEVVDLKSSEPIKTRELDLDIKSPGKARQRKKVVTWESDNNMDVKAKGSDKPAHAIHNSNQILVHVLFAVVSLTCGFWLARKIYL